VHNSHAPKQLHHSGHLNLYGMRMAFQTSHCSSDVRR
jgi:hypothetical protein